MGTNYSTLPLEKRYPHVADRSEYKFSHFENSVHPNFLYFAILVHRQSHVETIVPFGIPMTQYSHDIVNVKQTPKSRGPDKYYRKGNEYEQWSSSWFEKWYLIKGIEQNLY